MKRCARKLLRLLLAVLYTAPACALTSAPLLDGQPPRIRALLEQAWALENGTQGQMRDQESAAALYCEAARHGSPEGHYRSALLHLNGDETVRDKAQARSFISFAQELGHPLADQLLISNSELAHNRMAYPPCLHPDYVFEVKRFDLDKYVTNLHQDRRNIAQLIVRLAPEYGVPPRLALAIAAVESNFDARAISPKLAMGVMQLMPDTARRFGIREPFNPEQNIRGGLAYLKWLLANFSGSQHLAIAAYNAGEGAVKRYGGIPPYPETRSYLIRVTKLAQ